MKIQIDDLTRIAPCFKRMCGCRFRHLYGAIYLHNLFSHDTKCLRRNGCTSSCSKTVTVPIPACTIAGDGTICEGESTKLCAPYGYGYTYLWSTGATSRCISVDAAGEYSLAVTQKGCVNTCTKSVTVNPVPSCSLLGIRSPRG